MPDNEQSHIRRFEDADLASVQRLIWHTIDLSYANVYPPRAVAFFKEIHNRQAILDRATEGAVFVLVAKDRLVGTGSLIGNEILAMFVDPDRQHSGYGHALMDALESEARSKAISEIELSVSLPSRKFYERLGYEIVETCSRDVGQGQTLDFWKAKKALTAAA